MVREWRRRKLGNQVHSVSDPPSVGDGPIIFFGKFAIAYTGTGKRINDDAAELLMVGKFHSQHCCDDCTEAMASNVSRSDTLGTNDGSETTGKTGGLIVPRRH